MLLAYVNYHDPKGDRLSLCIIPERLDPLALPVKVTALCTTENAVIRISALEGIKVKRDMDGGFIIEAVEPSKLFLTPSQPDLPGIQVKNYKIINLAENNHEVYFKPLMGGENWRPWNPNEKS